MLPPRIPDDEQVRIDALQRLEILDTPPEERFDRITRLARALFEVPIVLVSLVDRDRQWFKSCQGLAVSETPREISFCGHAILGAATFSVPDTALDERFVDNPLVQGPPFIRSYYGAPLHTPEGSAAGTLCLIDRQPRRFSDDQLARLRDLADIVEVELELTSLRQKARQLGDERARLQTVLNTVVEGILTIDASGAIVGSNPAAQRIFGYGGEELVGESVARLIPEEQRERDHGTCIGSLLRRGKSGVDGIGRELMGRRKDGTVFPMELAIGQMMVGGGHMFAAVVRDITERKRMERVKREFISTVSHELRTPLTSIRGALTLVLGKFADALPAKPRQMLEMAARNGERLTLLINDLLDLERIEADRLELDFRAVDLRQLARRACDDSEGYASEHDVKLRLSVRAGEATVWGDESRLLQVLANLISNAIKFSPRKGTVDISVTPEGDECRVGVRDRGPGIPEEFRTRIFQRFAQADSSDTRGKGGTGLGLSISKAIVERHGGRIGFESAANAGAFFFIELRRWRGPVSPAPGTGVRALICEDNPDVAEILARLLQAEGIASDRAPSAAAFRQLVAARAYDLLLLDLALPDADGLQLLDELRRDRTRAELPVIVVSGRAREGRGAFAGDALAVVDWLRKPIDTERLARALREALGRSARPRILHVEDDPDIVQVAKSLMEDWAEMHHAVSLGDARRMLSEKRYDLVLLDLSLGDGSGAELLDDIEDHCPIVILSAHEASKAVSARVDTALTKSRTSNEVMVNTIKQALVRRRKNDA